jgi:recombination protein RecA
MIGEIMNRNNRAKLIGIILGDGCLKLKHCGYVELSISHTPKQLEYLEYKKDLIHSIFGGKEPKVHKETTTLKSNNKTYTSFRVSKQAKYLQQLRRIIYSNEGKKYYSERVLGYLTPEALAYWYMDDGSLVVNLNKEGNVSSFEVRIYTYCSLPEALKIQKFFKEDYNILAKVSKYSKSGSYNIKFNTTEGKKFLELTHKFIVPCMTYKWDTSSKTRARNISMRDDDIV